MNSQHSETSLLSDLQDMANLLRIHCIEMTEKAESGYHKYLLLYHPSHYFQVIQPLVHPSRKSCQSSSSTSRVCTTTPQTPPTSSQIAWSSQRVTLLPYFVRICVFCQLIYALFCNRCSLGQSWLSQPGRPAQHPKPPLRPGGSPDPPSALRGRGHRVSGPGARGGLRYGIRVQVS